MATDEPADKSTVPVLPKDTSHDESDPAPRSPAIVAERNPSPANPTKPSQEGNTPVWTRKDWFEAIAVLTAIGLLIVNIFQSCATQRAANAANSAANTAYRQLIDTERSLAASSAAICNFVLNNRSGPPYMYITVSCEPGKVDAKVMGGEFEVSTQDLQTNQNIGSVQKFQIGRQLIRPGGTLPQVNFDVAAFDASSFYSLHHKIVIRGSFEYDDGFARIIPVEFCKVVLPFRSSNGQYNGMAMPNCGGEAEDVLRSYREADKLQPQ